MNQYPICIEVKMDYRSIVNLPGFLSQEDWCPEVLGDVPYFNIHFKTEDGIDKLRTFFSENGIRMIK
ncbi:Hypothetical protein HVR_LOCUS175 [uncultured virus]|nr:Hypothetical protein HVR_LOCUS175 [uncultured virus]